MAVGVDMVTDVAVLLPETTVAVTTGTTPVVNAAGHVTATDPVKEEVTLATILNGMPSMTFVFSCAAVSVLPAVNVNLPDISGLSIVGKLFANNLA